VAAKERRNQNQLMAVYQKTCIRRYGTRHTLFFTAGQATVCPYGMLSFYRYCSSVRYFFSIYPLPPQPTVFSPRPAFPVQAPVLNGFGQMLNLDIRAPGQIPFPNESSLQPLSLSFTPRGTRWLTEPFPLLPKSGCFTFTEIDSGAT
jgi:hypothetical protein